MCNLLDIVRVEVLCFDGGSIDFNLNVGLYGLLENIGAFGCTYIPTCYTFFFPFASRWSCICSRKLTNLLL